MKTWNKKVKYISIKTCLQSEVSLFISPKLPQQRMLLGSESLLQSSLGEIRPPLVPRSQLLKRGTQLGHRNYSKQQCGKPRPKEGTLLSYLTTQI